MFHWVHSEAIFAYEVTWEKQFVCSVTEHQSDETFAIAVFIVWPCDFLIG